MAQLPFLDTQALQQRFEHQQVIEFSDVDLLLELVEALQEFVIALQTGQVTANQHLDNAVALATAEIARLQEACAGYHELLTAAQAFRTAVETCNGIHASEQRLFAVLKTLEQ